MEAFLLAGTEKRISLMIVTHSLRSLANATPPIYSTEPVKEGVGLSASSEIEDFSARCMFDIILAVLRLDYACNYDTVDLTLIFTDVCK